MDSLLGPWRHPGRLGRAAAFVAIGLPFSIVTFVVIVVMSALSVGLLPVFLLGVPLAWLTLVVSRGLGRLERSRAAAYGPPIPDPVAPLVGDGVVARFRARFASRARWREFGFHFLQLFVCTLSYVVCVAAWCGSLAMLILPGAIGSMPGDTARFYFFDLGSDPTSGIPAAIGVAGLLIVAPWVTIGAAELQYALARRLLGPSGDELLVAQVAEAQSRRSAAVDSAEAERRRIERDLHDGAQQRLVALAATLGAARERLDDDPDSGKEMVAAAHEEAKAALGEIRDLVRGIHPVILEDRGIDAALSAVVARSPVPVHLEVEIAERPPAAVESAAYFVVTEALTNVARHSGATRADVSIARAGDRLVVEVRDNGHGGADASKGSGIAGLRERVAGMGGSTYVISPEGGPTTILVELPCGS
jgi:signal transduction histidine kinase